MTVGPDEVVSEEGAVQAFDPVRYGNWLEGNKDDMGRYVLPMTQGQCSIWLVEQHLTAVLTRCRHD